MDYLPLFLLLMAVLIAAWFYLQRAKARDAGKAAATDASEPAAPQNTEPPADRPQ